MLSNGVAYSTFDRNIISVCFEVFHDKSFFEGGVRVAQMIITRGEN